MIKGIWALDFSMSFKTLIVDDEPLARKVLREELESITGVEVVGEADDGPTALAKIAQDQPDLVLLDLQMPVMSGFDVIRSLRAGARVPVIVIVTAYDEFALQAFEAGAIDYLLTPVGHDRLVEALGRARRLSGRENIERLAKLQDIADPAARQGTRRIVGRAGQEFFLLSADEIYAFQADGDLVRIITPGRTFAATQTLRVLEQRLKNAGFRRIHRNALVNVDHVRKVCALSSQRWLITLTNNQEFIASKRQARSVRQLLGR
jgi:DNA-binding LytR/AlgR family response regulator